jgi:hypothetical protein
MNSDLIALIVTDHDRFGKLRLHGHIRVGKDRRAWQDLDCYLFSEMLICVKERKSAPTTDLSGEIRKPRCTLKGSILIKKHLKDVETSAGKSSLHSTEAILTPHCRRKHLDP